MLRFALRIFLMIVAAIWLDASAQLGGNARHLIAGEFYDGRWHIRSYVAQFPLTVHESWILISRYEGAALLFCGAVFALFLVFNPRWEWL